MVNLYASGFKCYNFMPNPNQTVKMSVVIAPIKIVEKEDTMLISWACSMGSSCECPYCRYSKRYKEREEKEESELIVSPLSREDKVGKE